MIQIEDDSQRLPQKDLFDQLLEDAGQNSNLRMHSLLCQTMENGVGVE